MSPRVVVWLACIALVGGARADWELRLVEVFASDETGARRDFRLGEGPVFLTARVRAQGSGEGAYDVELELAGRKQVLSNRQPVSGTTSSFVWSPGFSAHAVMPYRVRLRTGPATKLRSTADLEATGEVRPVFPVEDEWYDARRYEVHQKWTATFATAGPTELVAVVPVIADGRHQRVLTWTKDDGSGAVRLPPSDAPVLRCERAAANASPALLEQRATVRVASYRANPAFLDPDWSAYETLPYEVRPFLTSPAPREGETAALETLSSAALSGDAHRYRPRETAERLFLATINALQYDAGGHSQVAEALRDKVAVCEAFAETYARLLRKAGIPARVVNGWIADGTGGPKPPLDAHSWVEVWFVNAGWVPQDPTFADTAAPGASVPFYFYTVPDMNRRIAVSYNVPYRVKEGIEPVGLVGPAHWYRFDGDDPKPAIERVFTIEALSSSGRDR